MNASVHPDAQSDLVLPELQQSVEPQLEMALLGDDLIRPLVLPGPTTITSDLEIGLLKIAIEPTVQ